MEVRRTLVTDKRTVSIDVADAPEHRTPGGRTPIAPSAVVVEMWLSPWNNELKTIVEIRGRRLEDPKRGQYLQRRLALADAPEWARELAEQQRPDWTPTEAQPTQLRTDCPSHGVHPHGDHGWVCLDCPDCRPACGGERAR
jgi:cell division protein FtsN